MATGIDTSFLVAVECVEHPEYAASRELLADLVALDEPFALNPDVLSEFVHTVTDPKRFPTPLSMPDALSRAEYWRTARESKLVFPTTASTKLFVEWMTQFQLGRKRLRDTMLAASYFSAGVTRNVTLNAKGFRVFGCFEIIEPLPSSPPA